jgi:hypothetical protein
VVYSAVATVTLGLGTLYLVQGEGATLGRIAGYATAIAGAAYTAWRAPARFVGRVVWSGLAAWITGTVILLFVSFSAGWADADCGTPPGSSITCDGAPTWPTVVLWTIPTFVGLTALLVAVRAVHALFRGSTGTAEPK